MSSENPLTLSDREISLIKFALWRLSNDAWSSAKLYAEKGLYYNPVKSDAYHKDAVDTDSLINKVHNAYPNKSGS